MTAASRSFLAGVIFGAFAGTLTATAALAWLLNDTVVVA